MTVLPALSLHQPWATLCVTRPPCACGGSRVIVERQNGGFSVPCICTAMVKWLETRSFPAPKRLIGQRFLIHATKRKPDIGQLGRFDISRTATGPWMWPIVRRFDQPAGYVLPLGAVVGSAVMGEPLPIVGESDAVPTGSRRIERTDQDLVHHVRADGWTDVTDQLPYGDFTPGRWAWPLLDAAPTTERCPNCWGERGSSGVIPYEVARWRTPCPVCNGAGHCSPIPAKGRQQIGWPCDLGAL